MPLCIQTINIHTIHALNVEFENKITSPDCGYL